MERLGSESERYLRIVVSGLPIWVRSELQDELRAHLADGARRRVEAGADPVTAEAQALDAFGPADELRRELQRVHRRRRLRGWLGDALAALLARAAIGPLRGMAPTMQFSRDYTLGRYDAIIVRLEHELRVRGPRYHIHGELGLAYNAVRQHERALDHFRAEADWLREHPLPRFLKPAMALATSYSNLAGVLEALGRREESEAVVREGLAIDASHPMLHLQRSRQLAARGEGNAAIGHLESAFGAPGTPPGFEKVILLFAQDPSYGEVREDLRFQRVLLRAAAS